MSYHAPAILLTPIFTNNVIKSSTPCTFNKNAVSELQNYFND